VRVIVLEREASAVRSGHGNPQVRANSNAKNKGETECDVFLKSLHLLCEITNFCPISSSSPRPLIFYHHDIETGGVQHCLDGEYA
jgi:hypothetical protein